MSSAESAARARQRLARRVAAAPDAVAAVPDRLVELMERPRRLPRMLVTTGIGTSEGHARHLAEVAARWLGQPARFASTGSLARATPRGAESDWLVVFSQGLSPNARHALARAGSWGGVVLVTGLPRPDGADAGRLSADERAWLEELHAIGGVQVEMGCGAERGLLVRVIGARVGYAIAWSLVATLAARRLEAPRLPGLRAGELVEAQRGAALRASDLFPDPASLLAFFDRSRPLLLVGEGGGLELAGQLALKIAEGMLRPEPRCIDVLGFAHGPLQSLVGHPASILYVADGTQGPVDDDWLRRLEATLDPAHHALCELRASLPWPFAVVEHEAMLDELLLRGLSERSIDLSDWPGADREAALYREGPEPLAEADGDERPAFGARAASTGHEALEEIVWPELASALESGRRSALLPLGSTEQHGPHLPLGTDTWIADALGRGLAERLGGEAIALPALAFGCASEHMAFPGTLHVEPATLEALLGDLLGSLAQHGFERVFVFSAHGGNVAPLAEMAGRLVGRAAPVALHVDTQLEAVARMQRRVVAAEGLAPSLAGPHAGEYETSVVAGLRPGLIRPAALAPGVEVAPEQAQSLFHPDLREHAETGVVGDPSFASADRARRYLEGWVDLLESSYRAVFPDASDGQEKKRQWTKGAQKA